MHAVLVSSGQIVDDTTKLEYGPETTRYTTLKDIKAHDGRFNALDTTAYDLESFDWVDKNDHKYQDLGNLGTALNPLFIQLPKQIGASSGFNAFDPYFKDPSKFKYFDTRSPFIDLFVALGGQNRSIVDFDFSRNINPRLNVGFDITRITSDKQIGADRSQGDRNVVSTMIDFYGFYRSLNDKYKVVFNSAIFTHKVEETGGILQLDTTTTNELFLFRDANIRLEEAQIKENRFNFHLYHQYQLKAFFRLYHQFDRIGQSIRYTDFTDSNVPGTDYNPYDDFYNQFLIDPDSTFERPEYAEIRNEVGITGLFNNIFYTIYLKRRDIDYTYLLLDPVDDYSENFLGVKARYNLTDSIRLGGQLEFRQGGDFKLEGYFKSGLLNVSYSSVRTRPSFLVSDYFGNHHEWHNSFDAINYNQIKGDVSLNIWRLKIKPKATITSVEGYVYYGLDQEPDQTNETTIISNIGSNVGLVLPTSNTKDEAFVFENELIYTLISNDTRNVFRIPDWFYNGKIYWKGKLFNDFMPVQVGFDLFWRSSYFGYDYNPAIQQFHLQDDFELKSYMPIDAFINFTVDKVSVFFKWTHLNQPDNDGYFVTPFYPGQERIIDLGVRWIFFD
ncbi:MAG TPA: putative porin [Cyclobacteriaceae bacterium]